MISWKDNALLKHLTVSQLEKLQPYIQSHSYKEGDIIVQEGNKGDKLYLIENGTVEIFKENIVLGHRSTGEYFGAMALIDKEERSATVKAKTQIEIQSIGIDMVEDLSREVTDSIYARILQNHINSQQGILRTMNTTVIQETKQKLEEAQKRISLSDFFLFNLGVLITYLFILGIFLQWKEFAKQRLFLSILTPIVILLVGWVCFRYTRKSGFPPEFFGLSTKNWKKHIWESILWTLPFVILLVLIRVIWVTYFPSYEGQPLFRPSYVEHFELPLVFLFYLLYALFCPIQEFVARGIYQSGFQYFGEGKNSTLRAILISNFLFSSFHLYLNFYFAIITFIPGLFWGFMYARQKNLVGVSLSHTIIGLATSFIGFR